MTGHAVPFPLTRRRFLGAAGAAATVAFLPGLAACGGDDDSGGAGSPGGKVTLTWWDYYDAANEKAVLDRIARYEKANPNVKVERTGHPFAQLKQKLLQGASAGELPDIVVIDNPDHSAFAALGVLADITDLVDEWGQDERVLRGPVGLDEARRTGATGCPTTQLPGAVIQHRPAREGTRRSARRLGRAAHGRRDADGGRPR